MLIIKEIDFNQKKIIGFETDEKLIEISLTKTKLKIVFNLEKTIIIKKNKNKEKIVDVFVDEEDDIIEEIKDEVIEEPKEEEVKEIIEEVIEEVKPQRKKRVSKAEKDKEEYEKNNRLKEWRCMNLIVKTKEEIKEDEPKEEEEEEVKEIKQEEPKEEEEEEVKEIKQEEPNEEEKEIIDDPNKIILLEEMTKILKEQTTKKNTFDNYYRCLMDVYNHFKLNNINELLRTNENEIIKYIETKYENSSTIKSKLCGIYKCYKVLNIKSDLFKNKIEEYKYKTQTQTDKAKNENKKDEDEGNKMIEEFEKHYKELEQKIKNDLSLLTEWKQEAQLFCLLKLYLQYGVLRSSEIINCLITDNDDNNKINYINIKTKNLVINIHKNDKKGPKIIELDDEFLKYIKPGLDKYLICNKNGLLYKNSSSFAKFFKNTFSEYNVYDLRRAICSRTIEEGITSKIKKLEYIQGHTIGVMLEFYNVYSKKQENNKEIVIGI